MDITFQALKVKMSSICKCDILILFYFYFLCSLPIFWDVENWDLQDTDIGRHVNRLRKHSSSEVRILVKQLVRFLENREKKKKKEEVSGL